MAKRQVVMMAKSGGSLEGRSGGEAGLTKIIFYMWGNQGKREPALVLKRRRLTSGWRVFGVGRYTVQAEVGESFGVRAQAEQHENHYPRGNSAATFPVSINA